MTDKPTPTDAATPECLTCSDHGAVGNSGFDHKTAADFLSGKTVSDEALRKFVAASRGAHDARAALHAKMLSLQGELASREAEIALLKRSLLDAEADAAAPQPVAREPQCWCLTCRPMRFEDPYSIRMALCPTCGNKRCPKANDHRNTCTGSNEPGQPGSAYFGGIKGGQHGTE